MAKKSIVAAVTLNCIVAFFLLGAGAIESLLNYPLWRDLGPYLREPADFGPWRAAHFTTILLTLPLPTVLHTALTLGLAWVLRRSAIRKPIWTSLAGLLFAWGFGAIVIIPMQLELDRVGYSREILESIIRWDALRAAGILLSGICWAWVLAAFVSGRVRAEDL